MIDTVLFDLDGTLLDTAADLAAAMNKTLNNRGKPDLDFIKFRPAISGGTKGMLTHCFAIPDTDPEYSAIKTEFLNYYNEDLTSHTSLFPKMDDVLDYLDDNNIPWGIVTNKAMQFAEPIIAKFNLHLRSICLVGGDTLKHRKPHPEPLLYACKITERHPHRTVYIGDTEVDMIAAKGAGMHGLAVMHGYRSATSKPDSWHKDKLIQHPHEIIEWFKSHTL